MSAEANDVFDQVSQLLWDHLRKDESTNQMFWIGGTQLLWIDVETPKLFRITVEEVEVRVVPE
jgi:hypothetical protein